MLDGRIYTINYGTFREQLLPLILRRPKLGAMLKALTTPLVLLYNKFFGFQKQAIYKTEHNASITLLQKVLNDAFDDIERRIFINNATITATQHYYDVADGEPLIFYDDGFGNPQWFFDLGTFNVYGSDFTVFLPMAARPLSPEEEERFLIKVRSALDYYKMFGTKYTIVWLN